MNAHDSRAIANVFVQRAKDAGRLLTIMPLVKFVYFAHGWTLGHTGGALIEHDVEAWVYGPVVREVYEAFRSQGVIISDFAVDNRGKEYKADLHGFPKRIVDSVYKEYSVLPTWRLSNITHRSDSPWSKYRGKCYSKIPNDEIKDYYEKLVDKMKEHDE